LRGLYILVPRQSNSVIHHAFKPPRPTFADSGRLDPRAPFVAAFIHELVSEGRHHHLGGLVLTNNRRIDFRAGLEISGRRAAMILKVRCYRPRARRNSVPAVFHSESQASAFIRARIAEGTVVHADEAGSWDNLHERFEVKRINHQEAYSPDGACTNWAEEYFSHLRRAEIGVHHHIAGAYLLRYAQESSWRKITAASRMAIKVCVAALGSKAWWFRV
jgi:ISXO2-like transposase domain